MLLRSHGTEGRFQTDGDFREGRVVETLLLGGGGGGAGHEEGDQLLVDQEDGEAGAEELEQGGGTEVAPYGQPSHRIQGHSQVGVFV